MKRRDNKGAVELSIGTIVIIVLAMSMLILGLVLVKNIFSGATEITDLTNEQLRGQVEQLFGEDRKLVVYPSTRQISVKAGEPTGFGIGIKNLLRGVNEDVFSYEVIVSDPRIEEKCNVREETVLRWISAGSSESDIAIAPGEFVSSKVLMEIPEGATLCSFRFRINVKNGDTAYASELMDIIIEA